MIIRKAKLEDCDAISEITKVPELVDTEGNKLPAKYFASDVNKDKFFFVAEEKNEILGFLLAFSEKGRVVYLACLGVKESARRQGVGKALMNEFKKQCKESGKSYIYFYAPDFNKNSLKFYESEGCVIGKKSYVCCSLEL